MPSMAHTSQPLRSFHARGLLKQGFLPNTHCRAPQSGFMCKPSFHPTVTQCMYSPSRPLSRSLSSPPKWYTLFLDISNKSVVNAAALTRIISPPSVSFQASNGASSIRFSFAYLHFSQTTTFGFARVWSLLMRRAFE